MFENVINFFRKIGKKEGNKKGNGKFSKYKT